jgi:tRNA(Ile)-lysidine synthase
MLDAFQSHLANKNLLNPHGTYLLACSGGMDSMCLGNLLIGIGISFEVVHVNFQLRTTESEGDQRFVQSWAESLEIPCHIKHADTKLFAEQKGISIQMAAREIRYATFEKVRAQRQLDGIILAHHEDDQLETIFLNLLRGTGIEGVYGMADRKGWLIRPLLPFSRAEIQNYMQTNQLAWREDSSNSKSDYKRNNLRINGLPAIYGLEPDAKKNLLTSFQRLKDTGRAFSGLFETWKKTNIREESSYQFLPFSALHNQPGISTLIYFWLRPYGFNTDQSHAIAEGIIKPKTGTIFKSPTHLIHFDREELVLAKINEKFTPIFISKGESDLIIPEGKYQVTIQDYNMALDRNPLHAQLDASRLEFPLVLRSWQEGDKFIPLGMTKSKKISDFLIDLKVPLAKKQAVKVLVSGTEIAWVVGLRIADWAKCTSGTQHMLHIKKTDP